MIYNQGNNPSNSINNEYILNPNYFPFNNNDFNQQTPQNNYLIYNDPILSARKRFREEYSNFSPLYSANIKAYTPLLSVNSPGVPGFFIFNNGGQSMNTTPLPFKIQNNVMLTHFFQQSTNPQNLNIQTLGKNMNIPNKSSHNSNSHKSDERDENSTIKDITVQSSNSLERNNSIYNNNNSDSNNLNYQMNPPPINSHANNLFMKKNTQSVIFLPSPIPVNNSFYGWIMNNANLAEKGQNVGNIINNNVKNEKVTKNTNIVESIENKKRKVIKNNTSNNNNNTNKNKGNTTIKDNIINDPSQSFNNESKRKNKQNNIKNNSQNKQKKNSNNANSSMSMSNNKKK